MPSHPQPRNLIVCCDGTGNYYNKQITNVVKLFCALDKSDPETQLCYYQPGIGTYASPDSVQFDLFEGVAKLGDLGFAWYLPAHIMSAYRFLMDNYHKGDKIYLFGFSRGAYTVRCLAGMLHKVGLLSRANQEHITFAYNLYADASTDGRKLAQGFRDTFSLRVEIEFVGVWDTVASVGVQFKTLPFTDSNTIIRTFRHAMSLDEHRVKFLPNPWKEPPKEPIPPQTRPSPFSHPFKYIGWLFRSRTIEALNAGNVYDDDAVYHHNKKTDVREVWFAGCHADVGGGSVDNEIVHSLANPSLKWMINEIIVYTDIKLVGGMFDSTLPGSIKGFHATMSTSANSNARGRIPSQFMQGSEDGVVISSPVTDERPPQPEPDAAAVSPVVRQYQAQQSRDTLLWTSPMMYLSQWDPKEDATSRIWDQLVKNPWWKIVEYFPLWNYEQDPETGVWSRWLGWHRGAPRTVPSKEPYFHGSVRIRKQAIKYEWAAKLRNGAVVQYVDESEVGVEGVDTVTSQESITTDAKK